MMKIFPLGSSSKGNSTYLESSKGAILIDAGFGARKTEQLLSSAGLGLQKISAIFITHEHYDHVAGLLSLTKKMKNVPIYGSKETLAKLVAAGRVGFLNRLCEIDLNADVEIAGFRVRAFPVLHDSSCCLGFCVYCCEKKFSICTDLGCVTASVLNNLQDSDFVILESNFDVEMLKNGTYPYILKKRIASKRGHLSNDEAAKLICWLVGKGVKSFLLGHLSEKNNLPQKALHTVVLMLQKLNFKLSQDYFLEVVPVKSAGKIYEL